MIVRMIYLCKMNRLWPVEYASIEVKEVIEVEESQEVLEVESTRTPEDP